MTDRERQKSHAETAIYAALHNSIRRPPREGVKAVGWDTVNRVAVVLVDGVEFNVLVSRRRAPAHGFVPDDRMLDEEARLRLSRQRAVRPHRFAHVQCSQCGREFGPGNFGFSHCRDHQNGKGFGQ